VEKIFQKKYPKKHVVVIIVSFIVCFNSFGGPRQSDSINLIDLYNSTIGDGWVNKTNWKTKNPIDTWFGVTVTNGRVSSIKLNNNGLKGSFSPLLSMDSLKCLRLDSNQIGYDLIGFEFFECTSLDTLWMQNNLLSGDISFIVDPTNLSSLRLNNNQFSGPIPPELNNLVKLKELYLNNNLFTGTMPAIGNLIKLKYLHLHSNQLSGAIPSSIGSDTSLTVIRMQQNQFSGQIPSSLGNLIHLDSLSLDNNQLSGAIPSAVGILTNLKSIRMSYNQITTIPSEMGNLVNLTELLLNNNQISGSIPQCLASLVNLRSLYLNSNYLTGTITVNFGAALQVLYLHHNQLSGQIPSFLGDLSNLNILRLDQNQLTGRIPSELGNLSNLTELHLESNRIKDTIPSFLGNLTNLQYLYLNSDSIYGSIPSFIGDWGSLKYLILDNNQLTDTIPSSLSNDTNLSVFSIEHNQLSGQIPAFFGDLHKMTSLKLGNNQFSDTIPSQLGSLAALKELFLDSNQLTGSIPASIGNLTNLISLSLASNYLTGTVPSLANLNTELRYLNVANDSLTGINSEVALCANLQFLDIGNNKICAPALVVKRWLDLFDPDWQNTQSSCTTSTITTLDSGLVAYWNFNEGTGSVAHDSYKRVHNSTVRGPTWVTGISGTAVNFQSKNDSITVPTNAVFNLSKNGRGITISAWIRTEGPVQPDSGQIIICRWQGTQTGGACEWALYINNRNQQLNFHIGPAPAAEYFSDSAVPTNAWLHVVATHIFGNSTSTKLFINGNQISGYWTGNGNKFTTRYIANPVTIGYNISPTQYFARFHGQMDDVRLYNRALSPAEIDSLYSQHGLGKRRYFPPFANPIIKYPDKITLGNAPNPFHGVTIIKFGIPSKTVDGKFDNGQRVILRIYNSQGKIVRTLENSVKVPGYYEAKWDGRNTKGNSLSTGVYIYKLTIGPASISRKMILR
jgi:Leucine-rich repeat (LRR) protein